MWQGTHYWLQIIIILTVTYTTFHLGKRLYLLFLFLTMVALTHAAKSNNVCEGDYCIVSPGNIEHLQDMLQSNRIVEFESGDYQITTSTSGGFIQVEDVVNLTIVGQGMESQIVCSPNATFGFLFKNVSNLTISGLSIFSCSIPVSNTLWNVSLLPCYESCHLFTNILENGTTISSSVFLVNSTAMLNRSNFISNNIGLLTLDSKLVLMHINFSCSPIVFAQNEEIILTGSVAIDQSPTYIIQSNVFSKSDSFETETVTLFVNKSLFEITSNSTVILKDYHSGFTAAHFLESFLHIKHSGKVILSNNTAYNHTNTFVIHCCNVTITDNAALSLDHNYATNHSAILSVGSVTTWNVHNNANITFQDNKVQDFGYIAQLEAVNINTFDNTAIIFSHNNATYGSAILYTSSVTWNVYNNANIILQDNRVEYAGYITRLEAANINTFDDVEIIFRNNILHYSYAFSCGECEILIKESKILITNNDLFSSSILFIIGTYINTTKLLFQNNTLIQVENNTLLSSFSHLFFANNTQIEAEKTEYLVTNNNVYCHCSIFYFIASTTNFKYTSFLFTDNTLRFLADGFRIDNCSLTMDSETNFSILNNNAKENGFIVFISERSFIKLSGKTMLQENNATDFGILIVLDSKVYFQGELECLWNRAEGGAISAANSELYFTGTALFMENTGVNGGAISMAISMMYISKNSSVNFTLNHATRFGGAIYVSNHRNIFLTCELAFACTFQVYKGDGYHSHCEYFTLIFDQNTAEIAGNAVYGDRISACMPLVNNIDTCTLTNCPLPDFSTIMEYVGSKNTNNLSNFTSDPTRVCFCSGGIPQCFSDQKNLSVYPGELFTLSLATIGYGFGTVPGLVQAQLQKQLKNTSLGTSLQQSQGTSAECTDIGYSIISGEANDTVKLAFAVNLDSFSYSRGVIQEAIYLQSRRFYDEEDEDSQILSPYDTVHEIFFNIPVFLNVSLLPCPMGFQLYEGTCRCAQILRKRGIDSCIIINGNKYIYRPGTYWIGLRADSSSESGIEVHYPCPYDYCIPDDINITVETLDEQCQFNRSGDLCGGCQSGLSTTLGSSECRECSNMYLTLILAFAVAGLVLVAFLFLLNLTVSVGTINGLVFYANIVQAISTTFIPMSDVTLLLRVFIAWVNLDLGISTCFYNGMDTYAKTWLQFVFPLYILVLVSAIIFATHHSTWAVKLFGSNAVPVLATLFLLSYAKMY